MSWLQAITPAFDVLKKGKELENAAVWKNRTMAGNLVFSIIVSVLTILKAVWNIDLGIDHDTEVQLAGGLVAVVGVVNAGMHAATSARVGLLSDSGSGPPPGPTADIGEPSAS